MPPKYKQSTVEQRRRYYRWKFGPRKWSREPGIVWTNNRSFRFIPGKAPPTFRAANHYDRWFSLTTEAATLTPDRF